MSKSELKPARPLGRRLTLLLVGVFIAVLTIGGVSLYSVLYSSALADLTEKGLIVIEAMNAVGQYTSQEVRPELIDRINEEFLPETVAAYSVNEVFNNFQEGYKLRDFSDFTFKQAVLNPINPDNQADQFEAYIADLFRSQNDDNPSHLAKETTGFRAVNGERYFYIARPIEIKNVSCLRCHSSPDIAPQSMISKYGTDHGFGWELNEVVGVQILHVPMARTFRNALNNFSIVIVVFAIALFAVVYVVHSWLNRDIVIPLNHMVQVTENALSCDQPPEFGRFKRHDEIAKLAITFNRLGQALRQKVMRLERMQANQRGSTRIHSNPLTSTPPESRNGRMPHSQEKFKQLDPKNGSMPTSNETMDDLWN